MPLPEPETTREEFELIAKIVKRTNALQSELDIKPYNTVDLALSLELAHHTCPMDLQQLLESNCYDFSHDVGGIMRHINRDTGQLEECFQPRCALSESDQTVNS